MRKRSYSAIALFAVLALLARAQQPSPQTPPTTNRVVAEKQPTRTSLAPPSIEGIKGVLVLSGKGAVHSDAFERFVTEAGGPKGKVVLVSLADGANKDVVARLTKATASVRVLAGADLRRSVVDAQGEIAQTLEEASGIWLTGMPNGDGAETFAVLATTVKRVLGRGGVLAGEGSLAAAEKFDLLTGVKLAALGPKADGLEALRQRVGQAPGSFGLGVEERSTVVVKGRLINSLGEGAVHILQGPGGSRAAGDKILKPREQADLVAQWRSAIARTQAPFPPEKPDVPKVLSGTLLIGGGGGLSEDIWKKFIDLAGGPEASIVVIPTAMEDPIRGEPAEARALKQYGARNVTVLHTRKREEADTEAFLKPLLTAKGVWFTGGRQWRFVDSYEGTATEKAFHGVLARGGVIGGSSAGASIQSEYMARGDPLGNLNIIAEGYERGFGFLKGVAVDQHFFARKRQDNMTELMKAYPQLLGIGIDEGTVIIVRGNRFEVVGKSKVAVYDRRKSLDPGKPDYEELPRGAIYDMEAGKRVEAPR